MSIARSIARPIAEPIARSVGGTIGGVAAFSDAYLALLADGDLIGAWRMNDNAANTTVTDSAASPHNGALAGGKNTSDISVAASNGLLDKAFQFDGVGDYVGSIGAVSDSPSTVVQNTMVFTLAWWQKVASATTRYLPIGNTLSNVSGKGFFVAFENGAGFGTKAIRLVVGRAGGGGTSVVLVRSPDNVITDTSWHAVAITCTAPGDNVAIYVDGNSVGALTYEQSYSSLSTGNADRVLNFGRANWTSTVLPLAGSMDEFLMFSRALSSAEILTLATL